MGVPVSQAEAVSAPAGTGTTIAITLPAHAEDDVLIVQVGWKGNQAPTTLTGWNLYFSQATGTATNGCGQGVWWRRVNPSETVSNPTLTIGTTSVERRAIAYCIRGADIDNPANTFWQKQQTVGNSATPTPPGITTLAPNYLLLHLVTCRGNSAVTPPTGYNEEQDSAEGTTVCVEGSTKTQATAATVSGQAASISSNRWVAAIIAIPSPDYPYFRSQTSTTANSTSVTGTLPTGTTEADFYGRADGMLAIVKAAGSGINITADAAWANVANWDIDTSTGSDSVEVFAAEYASGRVLQFSRPTSGVISVQLIAYRNIHQTAFIGNSSAKTQTGTPSTFDAQARQNTKSTVTTIIVADADTNNVHTAPSGFTERSDGLGIGTADRTYEDGGTTPSGSWTTTNAANVVGLIELLSHAGVGGATHERSATIDATASITTSATFFSVFTRASTIDASGSITTTGLHVSERSASLDASAAVSAAGARVVERSVVVSSTAAISVTGEFFTVFESAASLSATAVIESSGVGFSVFESGASINAAVAITISGTRVVERAASVTATVTIETSGQFFSVVERAAQVSATALIETIAEFFSVFERQAAIDATAAITTNRQVELQRQAALSVVANIAVSGGIEGGVFEHERSAALDATGAITVAGVVVRERSASLAASAALTVNHQRELQRTSSLSASAVVAANGQLVASRSVALNATVTITVSGSSGVDFHPRKIFRAGIESRILDVSRESRAMLVSRERRV